MEADILDLINCDCCASKLHLKEFWRLDLVLFSIIALRFLSPPPSLCFSPYFCLFFAPILLKLPMTKKMKTKSLNSGFFKSLSEKSVVSPSWIDTWLSSCFNMSNHKHMQDMLPLVLSIWRLSAFFLAHVTFVLRHFSLSAVWRSSLCPLSSKVNIWCSQKKKKKKKEKMWSSCFT